MIDHSVQVDEFGTKRAYDLNAALEFQRNRERYAFLKWGQTAFSNFSAVPPGMGICHQVNLEYLARVVFTTAPDASGKVRVLRTRWSVRTRTRRWLTVWACWAGASAALRPRPRCWVSRCRCWCRRWLAIRLTGKLKEGTTATDLVLTMTEAAAQAGRGGQVRRVLRARHHRAAAGGSRDDREHGSGVWRDLRHLPGGYGDAALPAPDRAQEEQIALVEAYYREQGMFHTADAAEAEYSATTVARSERRLRRSVAGPKRPQDRVLLPEVAASFLQQLPALLGPNANKQSARQMVRWEGEGGHASADGRCDRAASARRLRWWRRRMFRWRRLATRRAGRCA